MNEKGAARCSQKRFYDPFYASFHGFDKLEKEYRADGWFYGRASDFVDSKEELIRTRPRNCVNTIYSGCFICGVLANVLLLEDALCIVHGPRGCGNHMYVTGGLTGRHERVVCTEMDENDAIMGGERKLREAIREAAGRYRSLGMIAVAATCTSSIIGDDLEGICEMMEAEIGIPIIPLSAAGFKARHWNMASDIFFNKVIDRMRKAEAEEIHRGSINFINFPIIPAHWGEFFELLPFIERLGIGINAHIPCLMTFQEMVETFPRAELNVIRCPGMGYQCAEYAEKTLGIPYLRVGRPISLKYTEDFIRGLAEFFGRPGEGEYLIAEEQGKIEGRLERLRKQLGGKRAAIGAGAGKSLALAQLCTELGMEVVFLGVFKTDSLNHDLMAEFIESTGRDPEVLAEPSAYETEAILSRLRPDIFLGIAEERPNCLRLGIPSLDMLAISYPTLCGFEGVVTLGEQIVHVLESRLLRQWGRYLWKDVTPYSSDEFMKNSPLALEAPQRGERSAYYSQE